MNLDDVWIVIPVGNRERHLLNLLKKINKCTNRIVFVNNKPKYNKFYGVHHIEDFDEVNIHRWWNKGIDYAQSHGAKYVLVLNDDLDFDENFVESIYKFALDNNYYVVDVSNSSNNGGAAWILDLSSNLRPNEEFKWWYGDTFLFDQAKKMNKFAKIHYDGFVHLEPNKQTEENLEIKQLIGKDQKKYEEMRSRV